MSVALLLALAGNAAADTSLATFVYTGTGQTTAQPSWRPYISYGDPNTVSPVGYMNDVTLTLLDVINGSAYDLSGDFAGFESFATDGVNQPWYIGFTVPGGTGSSVTAGEQSVLLTASGLAAGVGSPDFAGYDLTRIRVMGTSFQSGVGGEFTVTTQYEIFGNVVPEPASAMAMTLLAATMRRRR